MLALIISMMFATTSPTAVGDVDAVPPFDQKALATCQAFVAQAPSFSQLSDDELSSSSQFIHEVMGMCGKSIVPLWDDAHARARTELKLPQDQSLPMTREEAGRSVGEMDVAERHLKSIVAERWSDARVLRHQMLNIPPATMAEYMFGWLGVEDRAAGLLKASNKPVECVGARMSGQADLNALMSGGRDFVNKARGCKFVEAVDGIASTMRQFYPSVDRAVAQGVADSFLREIVFWSLTGNRTSRPRP